MDVFNRPSLIQLKKQIGSQNNRLLSKALFLIQLKK